MAEDDRLRAALQLFHEARRLHQIVSKLRKKHDEVQDDYLEIASHMAVYAPMKVGQLVTNNEGPRFLYRITAVAFMVPGVLDMRPKFNYYAAKLSAVIDREEDSLLFDDAHRIDVKYIRAATQAEIDSIMAALPRIKPTRVRKPKPKE